MIPVYVISLARSLARCEQISQQLNKIGMAFEVFPAVDGETLDLSTLSDRLQDRMPLYRGFSLTRGEIGCFLSHYQIYQRMVANNTPYAVILEDDAVLSEDFADIIDTLPTIDWRWDIVRFSAFTPHQVMRTICSISRTRFLVRYRPAWSTAAYAISLRGAKALCKSCYKIRAPIDIQYSESWDTGLHFADIHPPPAPAPQHGAGSTLSLERGNPDNTGKSSVTTNMIRNCAKRYARFRFYLWDFLNPPQKR